MAKKNGRLSDVILYLKSAFPQITRITSYGRAESLCRISVEEYAELRAAGLTRIHSGYESGSDVVLDFIHKGVTAQQEIQAGKNIKAGGIEFSVYFMPGVGGRALSQENARGMAHVVSEIDPHFLRIRTVAVKQGTELYEEYASGRMELCSDDEKVLELQTLIENCHCQDTVVASDHIINLLPHVMGKLPGEKQQMLGVIQEYLALPELDRRIYQLLRRSNSVESVAELHRISAKERQQLVEICERTPDERRWAEQMNAMIARYV